MSTLDDEQLIQKVAGGDASAYRELVLRHGARLHHFALRVTGSAAEAEDVVQETFLRLWQRARDYSPRARVTTWLHRIALNLC
ncbi:MAG TPA: sigma-70 family RNA polymerase sigma factor, partial [Polyangiaceae bacterium]